jgi:hypothetical protein
MPMKPSLWSVLQFEQMLSPQHMTKAESWTLIDEIHSVIQCFIQNIPFCNRIVGFKTNEICKLY